MSKQHYIDQRGEIVTTVGDRGNSCNGCAYQKSRNTTPRFLICRELVPAEHAEGNLLKCIYDSIVYRKVK